MGVVYREIERGEVVKVLKDRGYGEVGTRRYGLCLNRPTGRRYQSGGEIRVEAGGVSHEQLAQILRLSNDPTEAANRVEAIVLGKDIRQPEAAAEASSPGLSMEMAEKLITNRVAAEVTKLAEPIYRELGQVAKSVSDLAALMAKATVESMNKKVRAPYGSKTGKKKVSAETADAISKELQAGG